MHIHTFLFVAARERTEERGLPALPCVCATLRRAARAVSRLYEDEMRSATSLTGPQFTLLQTLSQAGPLTQGQLGRLLAIDSTTLSRTLRPLEAARLVRVEPGRDRRERHLQLTASGKSQIERATPAWELAQRRLKAAIGGERWAALMRELGRLADDAARA